MVAVSFAPCSSVPLNAPPDVPLNAPPDESTASDATAEKRNAAPWLRRGGVPETLQRQSLGLADGVSPAGHQNSIASSVMRQLEKLTFDFRAKRAKAHRSNAAAARREYRAAQEDWAEAMAEEYERACATRADLHGTYAAEGFDATWTEKTRAAVATQKWHDQRAGGQEYRFRKLAGCGTRYRITRCDMCGLDGRAPVPEGCGVARLCARCSLQNARKRRARFGRARARAIVEAVKNGACRKNRKHGSFGERMVTLTAPHFTADEYAARIEWLLAQDHPKCTRAAKAAKKIVADVGLDTVKLRVQAVWKAWPIFARKLHEHWRSVGESGVRHHRAAEWTAGHDGLGHPHFHVWVWSPFVDHTIVARMWTEALLEIGVPPPSTKDGLAMIDVKKIYGFDNRMAAELLKGGRREALTLSRMSFVERVGAGGEDVYSYASGWTMTEEIDRALPEVIASLYEVLEGKRLTQGSAGFFEEEPAKCCAWCTFPGHMHTRFVLPTELAANGYPDHQHHERERDPPS